MSSRARRGLVLAAAVAVSVSFVAPATGSAPVPSTAPTPSAASTPAAAPTTAPAAEPTAEATSQPSERVTLITGDVVTVKKSADGRTLASVEPAPGATGLQTLTIGNNLYAIPAAAQPLLAANKLDKELFNITKLVEAGYTAGNGGLPMIASYSPLSRGVRAVPKNAEKTADLSSINATAIVTAPDKLDELWREVAPNPAAKSPSLAGGIEKIWLDGKVKSTLESSVPMIGAPEAWAAGYDGTGVTVAVLDSGIDATHPDFAGNLVEAVSFVPDNGASVRGGHGTHVASTIAGSGAASDGKFKGVAPGAKLLAGRVLDANGYGQMSWIIAGMEWAATKADVVNMSLGDPQLNDGTDPMAQALQRISDESGTLFVVAAGNSGLAGSIGSPGTADAALTVAAVDRDDVRAYFSSMGPRGGDNGMKPDIAAPGVDIVAARSAQTWGEGYYMTNSGTSMASPHITGAAAILIAKHPDWDTQALKDALVSSSKILPGTSVYEVGSGRVDIPATIDDLRATGSLFLGNYTWPHDGDAPTTKTITYTNTAAAAVDLTLAATLESPDRTPVPGVVKLSANTVTVPANGTAQVTVTLDADDIVDAAAGAFSGSVVATDSTGTVAAHTSLGLSKEQERYDLSISALGRDGKPTAGSVIVYRYGDNWVSTVELDPVTGKAPVQRVVPGIYAVTSWMQVPGDAGGESIGTALLGNPHLDFRTNTSIVLDARNAKKISVTTPKKSENRFRRMQYFHDSGIGGSLATFTAAYTPTLAEDDMFAAPTGPVPGGQYDFAVRWRRSIPLLNLTASGKPLEVIYQTGSVRLDGKINLKAVYAGTGSAAEFAAIDAKGKAALVVRNATVATWEQMMNAEAAGAALVIIVNDRPGKQVEYTGSTVPVVSVTKAAGDKLIALARGGYLTIGGTAVEFSPYMYDLARGYPGAIPANLAWNPKERDLARVDHRFVGEPGGIAMENRYDCRTYQMPPCLFASFEPVGTGTTRVDYLSTDKSNKWYQDVTHLLGWEQRHEQIAYKPGQRVSLDYFNPITRPRLGPTFWGPNRRGDFMAVNMPPFSSNDVTGSMYEPSGYVASRLYQNGQLVGTEQPYQAFQGLVPPTDGPAEYRFEMDTTRGDVPWRTSTKTKSAWTFKSATTTQETLLPLLQLDYKVSTDLKGNARAGGWALFGLSASQEPGVVGAGKLRGATLEISYDDGKTWKKVGLVRTQTGWATLLHYPRTGAAFVSVRASAWDDAGNKVQQEIIRAYGLK